MEGEPFEVLSVSYRKTGSGWSSSEQYVPYTGGPVDRNDFYYNLKPLGEGEFKVRVKEEELSRI